MAAASAAVSAAAPTAAEAPPLTTDDVARWLMREVNNAQELHDDYCLLAEAACHPQFDQLITHLHRLEKFDADDVGKHMFASVVDAADLPRAQWVANYFGLTAEHICSRGQCSALDSAANALDFAKADWLVEHFDLASRKEMQKWISDLSKEIVGDGSGSKRRAEMASHLRALFGC